jgi:transposase
MQVPQIPMTESRIGRSSKSLNPFIHNALMTSYGSLRTFVASDPLFNAAIHALRRRVDRTFAWEDTFKRLLLRFEHLQQRHFGMKLMAYTLINVREFCGA